MSLQRPHTWRTTLVNKHSPNEAIDVAFRREPPSEEQPFFFGARTIYCNVVKMKIARAITRVALHYSFDAAALSANQVSSPSSSVIIWTGSNSDELFSPPKACCTTPALPDPVATSAMFAEELITGKVKVILSGGGFGESLMKVIQWSFSLRRGCPGKREATWPSGPIPNSIRSNFGNPEATDCRTPVLTSCFKQVS